MCSREGEVEATDCARGFSRRKLLRWVVGGWVAAFLGAVIYPILRYVLPPQGAEPEVGSLNVGSLDDFAPNTGKIVRYGSKPVIVIRTAAGDVRAFSAICTHLQCTVQYRPDIRHIWCACHNGHYDLEGRNIAGPPPRPLERFDVRIDDQRNIVILRRTTGG